MIILQPYCIHIIMPPILTRVLCPVVNSVSVCSCKESRERAEQASRLLAQVKNGVHHLAEKSKHIKMVSETETNPIDMK